MSPGTLGICEQNRYESELEKKESEFENLADMSARLESELNKKHRKYQKYKEKFKDVSETSKAQLQHLEIKTSTEVKEKEKILYEQKVDYNGMKYRMNILERDNEDLRKQLEALRSTENIVTIKICRICLHLSEM